MVQSELQSRILPKRFILQSHFWPTFCCKMLYLPTNQCCVTFHKTIISIFTCVRTSNFVFYNKILSLCSGASEIDLPLDWTDTVTFFYKTNLLFCVKKETGEETFPSDYRLFTFLWRNWLRSERSVELAVECIALAVCRPTAHRLDWTVPHLHRGWV